LTFYICDGRQKDMFETTGLNGFRLSEQVADLIKRAEVEAEESGHQFVTAEDLLLAILGEKASEAFEIIASLTRDFGFIEKDILDREDAIRDRRLLNPSRIGLKVVLQSAQEGAQKNNRIIVETSDLLQGILSAEQSFASEILSRRNLSLKGFRAYTGYI